MKKIIIFLSVIFALLLYIQYQTEVLKEADNPDSVEFVFTQEQESVDFDIEAITGNITTEFTKLRTARDNTAVVVVCKQFIMDFFDFEPRNNNKGVPIYNLMYTTWKNKDIVTYIVDNYNIVNYDSNNITNTIERLLLAYDSLATIGCMPRGPTYNLS